MQVPLDFPAISAVATMGAAVMRRAEIQPKALDATWTEYPNLWGAIVANPGMMKSPVIDAATAPLRQIESPWRTKYASELSEAKTNKRTAELKSRAWEQSYVAALKKEVKEIDLPTQKDDTVPEPRQKRMLTSDATFEKLHEIMADNPPGIACWRDELTAEMAAAQTLGRKLKAGWQGEKKGIFSLRDLYRPQWSGLTSPDEARSALHVLCEYGWIRKDQTVSNEAGRHSEINQINPEIAEVK